MGAWGYEILEDDIALDVHADYLRYFNVGKPHDEILRLIVTGSADLLADDDDATVIWLAIARAQWDCGGLAPEVIAKVETIVREEIDLKRWTALGKPQPVQRRRALDKFLEKLRTPNPRPRKPRKAVKRKPIFATGDCLSIRLSDGDYGAAIVLDCPPERQRIDGETYGKNFIGVLRYKGNTKPSIQEFERRDWLYLTHHAWFNHPRKRQLHVFCVLALRFRAVKDKFEVVGITKIRETDPKYSLYSPITGWHFAEQIVYQAKWDAGDRGPV
jgi:hypothetical protein